jgi:ABC-type Fe3+/spermidine/putrescine transport system ATPase subunit
VFVTHDQTEALTMADRVTVLKSGQLQQIGSPQDLYETPATEFVAGFIGETNFWSGTAKENAGTDTPVAVTLDGATTVQAIAASPVQAGGRVRLAVRPERVRIGAPDVALAATVQEAIYSGTNTTLLLRTAGPIMRVRLPTGAGAAIPKPGETTTLTWQPEDARAFPVPA